MNTTYLDAEGFGVLDTVIQHHGQAVDLAAVINAAFDQGRKVTVNSRPVARDFGNRPVAHVYGTGTLAVSVVQRGNPKRSTDTYIKVGQVALIEITE